VFDLIEELRKIEQLYPGKALELRIIGVGVITILPGSVHKRGTPSNVVEMDAYVFQKLISKDLTFTQACEQGLVEASGVLSDLSYIFK
jgi:hypothetical protein